MEPEYSDPESLRSLQAARYIGHYPMTYDEREGWTDPVKDALTRYELTDQGYYEPYVDTNIEWLDDDDFFHDFLFK